MTTYLGDTIRVQATMTDFDDSVLTPDSHEVTLYDPDEVQQDQDTSPTAEGGGVFYADLDIPSSNTKGNWLLVWKVTMSGKHKFEELTINVDEAP